MGRECSSTEDMMLMKGVRASLWKLLRGITLKGGQFSDGYRRPGVYEREGKSVDSVDKKAQKG